MMSAEEPRQTSFLDIKARFEQSTDSTAPSGCSKETTVAKTKRLFEKNTAATSSTRYKPPIKPKPKFLSEKKFKELPPPPIPKHRPPSPLNGINQNLLHASSSTSDGFNRNSGPPSSPGFTSTSTDADGRRSQGLSDDVLPPTPIDTADCSSAEESVCDETSDDRGDDEPSEDVMFHRDDSYSKKHDTLHTSVIKEMKREGLFQKVAEIKKNLPTMGGNQDDESHDADDEGQAPDAPTDDVSFRPAPEVPSHRQQTQSEKYDGVDEEEKKRLILMEKLVVEICMKEEHFTNILSAIVEAYPQYLKKCDIESEKSSRSNHRGLEVIEQMVVTMQPILKTHESLLADLEEIIHKWDSRSPNLSAAVLRNVDFLRICIPFLTKKQDLCNAYKNALDSSKDFAYSTRRFEDEVMNSPGTIQSRFSSMAYTPSLSMVNNASGVSILQQMDMVHQNIVRYKLFMERYKKMLPGPGQEMDATEKVVRKLDQIVEKIDSQLGETESLVFLVDLNDRFQGRFDVLKPGRKFIRDGQVLRQTRKDLVERRLILFTDMILLCHSNLENFVRISLLSMKIEVEDSVERERWFLLYSQKKSTAILCASKEERDVWVQHICRAQNQAKNRRPVLHEATTPVDDNVVKFSALWIADDQASMCMMEGCAKKFSVINRRHHCRNCGYVICNGCSATAPLPNDSFNPLRVCSDCYFELQGKFAEGDLFPIEKIVWTTGTPQRPPFTVHSSEPKILYPGGKLRPVRDLFAPARNGRKKRGENFEKSDKFLAMGTVTVKAGVRYARLHKDARLYLFMARYDPVPADSHYLIGHSMSSSRKDDRTHFRLTHQTGPKCNVFEFSVISKFANMWEKALSTLLRANTPDDQ